MKMRMPDKWTLEDGLLKRNDKKCGCPYNSEDSCGEWCSLFTVDVKPIVASTENNILKYSQEAVSIILECTKTIRSLTK